MTQSTYGPKEVLDLWFLNTGHEKEMASHGAFWDERMQGGMDKIIIAKFAGLTEAAAQGSLDHWADTPRGRLALLIALDQFPRSLWRDTPAAFAQDCKATRLALEGIETGDFDGLEPWEQGFFIIAISHCEGPDHLERMHALKPVTERICARLPEQLQPMADGFKKQTARVLSIVETFGRHPHRNPIYGRISSADEEAYFATGDFPHVRKAEDVVAG